MHVVIAGAHGKIGLRLAALLAGRGDVVTGVVRNPDHRADLERAGASAAVCDVRLPEQCEAVVRDAAMRLGGLDVVVYATAIDPLVRLVDTDADRWHDVFATNVIGASLVTRTALAPLTDDDQPAPRARAEPRH